ncbi:MAG TPA: 50S ribosomal protein L11 methyltransferase [Stellaceae bacterium]|nr:50S ribosomal protein L11 methyltransferase [Stellaceae bacterium]
MIPVSPRRSGEPLWRLAVNAADEVSADAYAAALGEVATAVTAFETEAKGPWLVQGFTQGKPDLDVVEGVLALAALAMGQGEPMLEAELLPDVDWLKLNQESFPPLRVGRYFVHGSHVAEPVPSGTVGLLIDAATAFGTGEHATTYGCLKALDQIARRGRRTRILDMGTGTGILGIAAAKTWNVPVLGCDIDRNSVKVAAENVRINGVAALMRCVPSDGYVGTQVRQGAPYDLIFANILARPLAAMAPDLAHNLLPGGIAILSGLLAHQERYVAAAHRAMGLVFQRRIARQGWHTLIFEKPGWVVE